MVYITPTVVVSAAVVLLSAATGGSASPVASSKPPSPFTTLTVASVPILSATSAAATAARTCIPAPTIKRPSKGRTARGRKGRSRLPLCDGPAQTPVPGAAVNPTQRNILTELTQPTAVIQQVIAPRGRRRQGRGGASLTPEQQSRLAEIGAKAAAIFGGSSSTTTTEPTSTAVLAARAYKKKGGRRGRITLSDEQKERLAGIGSKAAAIFGDNTSTTTAEPTSTTALAARAVRKSRGGRRGSITLTDEQKERLVGIGSKAAAVFGSPSSTTTAEPTSTEVLAARAIRKSRGGRKGSIKLTDEQKDRLAGIGSKAAELFRGEKPSTSVSSTSTAEATQPAIVARRTRERHGRPARGGRSRTKPSGVTLTAGQKSRLSSLFNQWFKNDKTTTTTTSSSEASTSTSATATSTTNAPAETK